MEKKVKVLYISYDGMTDPLGESQVIPYLTGLSGRNIEIHILSAEKYRNFKKREKVIGKLLFNAGIVWHPVFYSKNPPVLSTINDIQILKIKALKLNKRYGFDIIHCRSYISAFVGMSMKKSKGTKFLFDMRGFYTDERVDGNLWPQSNILYRSVYNYFKNKEKQFLSNADYTISLTDSGKNVIHQFEGMEKIKIEVIPCCADLGLFNYENNDIDKINKLKEELKIGNNDFVVSYLGSVGTWYMLDEMMLFFKLLKSVKPHSKFLFITKDNPDEINNIADKYGIDTESIVIKGAERDDVPSLAAISDVSLFFIKPLFSKKASSPTKLAELLGLGIPVICNANVGDIENIVLSNNIGILINELNETGYYDAIENIDSLKSLSKEHLRLVAKKYFSLDMGVEKYYNVYSKLLEG